MKTYIPPLNALRVFDMVARTGTVVAAAERLSVSAPAISQQVRALEKWLGIALFDRSGQRLTLTDRGAAYFEAISMAMGLIADATGRLVAHDTEGILRVSIMPSFAQLWLLPRLGAFMNQHPEVTVDLVTTTTLVDFGRDDIDLAVRYGLGSYPGLVVEKLLPEAVVPVCHPRLLAEHGLDRTGGLTAADLQRLPTIDDAGGLKGVKRDLATWLVDQGVARPVVKGTLLFSDSCPAVEVARLGRGLLLGRLSLVRDLLDTGELVAPVERWLVEPTSYYIVSSGLRPPRPRARMFRDWLKRAARDWLQDPRCRSVFPKEAMPARGEAEEAQELGGVE